MWPKCAQKTIKFVGFISVEAEEYILSNKYTYYIFLHIAQR